MSAPNSAYLTETLPIQNTGIVRYDNLLAYKLVEYGSNIKQLFYLDVLLMVENGFAGAVLAGGTNEKYHASARWNKLRLKEQITSDKYIILNDCGLNTFGQIGDTPAITQSSLSNFIITTFQSKSAYYVNGAYGVQINTNGGGWLNVQFALQAMKTTVNSASTNIYQSADEVGDVIQVRTYHLNAEGLMVSGVVRTVTITAGEFVAAYNDTYGSQATGSFTRYYNVRDLIGGGIYLDASATILAPAGYYVFDGKWYYFNGTIVSKTGNAVNGQWDTGDPANSFTRYFDGFTTNGSVVCTTSLGNDVTLYVDVLTGKFYTDANLNIYPSNGYYISEPFGPSSRDWIRIVDGVQIEQGFCEI